MTGNTAFYPYFQFGQSSGGAATAMASGHGYSVPYPPVLHYSAVASTTGLAGLVQHFGGPLSIAPTPPAHAGTTITSTYCCINRIMIMILWIILSKIHLSIAEYKIIAFSFL